MGRRLEKQYEILEGILAGARPRSLSLALLEDITENLSEERIIGHGGFGTVYKGVLGNKNVAVKRIHVNQYTFDERLFRHEVDILMMINNHPNLVRFLGFCSSTAREVIQITESNETIYPQIIDRLLCFEYIKSGSLDKHITDELRGLKWDARFGIIRGICEGLRYLHVDKHMIHMDLKPSYILLDDHKVPKITHFSQAISAENTHTEVKRFVSRGYSAPEYKEYGYTSDRADIYSLGVIIVELVTGSKHIPDVTYVLRRWRHRWNQPPTQVQHQQVMKCLEIALCCREQEPGNRPSITDIVRVLSEIESTNGTIGQTSPYLYDDMLGIEPLELRFSLEHNKQTPCLLELTNKTINLIAFNIATPSKQYSTQPDKGIVLPGCKRDVKIILQPQEIATPVVFFDKFVVQSTQVNEGLADEDITDHMFKSKVSERVVDEVDLMVVYELQKYQEDGSLDRQEDAVSKSGSKPSLSLQHLKDITKNFAEERILGQGSFGVVYKGLLDNGEMVAVKKLLQATPSSLGQLENELILLKTLEHKNIVQLVGHCYETEPTPACQKGKSFFASDIKILLCLEYMPNGSLDKYIKDASLNWHTRWEVIEGISYGLQYLHEHSNEPIIHLDLKPANILLDVNMLPKITDFGLSRLFDQNKTICTASAGGTIGYMPPEYTRGIITPMWDIFSLGVIIMEVITGHRKYPDDNDIRNDYEGFIELELQKWRNRLQKEPGFTSLEKDCQLIERCIQIGLICMNPDRTKRPTIKKVIDMLEGTESMVH